MPFGSEVNGMYVVPEGPLLSIEHENCPDAVRTGADGRGDPSRLRVLSCMSFPVCFVAALLLVRDHAHSIGAVERRWIGRCLLLGGVTVSRQFPGEEGL